MSVAEIPRSIKPLGLTPPMKRSFCFLAAVLLLGLPACTTNKKLGPMESAEGGPIRGDGPKGNTFIPSGGSEHPLYKEKR